MKALEQLGRLWLRCTDIEMDRWLLLAQDSIISCKGKLKPTGQVVAINVVCCREGGIPAVAVSKHIHVYKVKD